MPINRRRTLLSLSLAAAAPRMATAARSDFGTPRLLQGPMAGASGHDRLRVWCRLSGAYRSALVLGVRPDLAGARVVSELTAAAEDDFTVVHEADGLAPGSHYYYRILIEGAPDKYLGGLPPVPLRTAPRPGDNAGFRVAFGSCARVQADPEQPIWHAVQQWRPDLFLWLGDNVYGDSRLPAVLAEQYRRQRDVPSAQPVLRTVPQLAIWDDHDFGLNDHDRTNPIAADALTLFRRYWANPAYGRVDAPGVFFSYRFGAVDFFMLDGRSYRDPNEQPDLPGKTILGERQRRWLQRALVESDATFKILACGSGWTTAKGPGGDSWASFLTERNDLFDFIRDRQISGVVLISGDTHVGELNAIPRAEAGGYDLYDLVSSPLAQPPTLTFLDRSPEVRIRTPYAGSANFGVLDFSFDPEPRLRYQLVDVHGRTAREPLDLSAADLRNGASTWREKQRLG